MTSLFRKVIATVHTVWRQITCLHGPWIFDMYSEDSFEGQTSHCQQCWKTEPTVEVGGRYETEDEYVQRVGMPEKTARQWYRNYMAKSR